MRRKGGAKASSSLQWLILSKVFLLMNILSLDCQDRLNIIMGLNEGFSTLCVYKVHTYNICYGTKKKHIFLISVQNGGQTFYLYMRRESGRFMFFLSIPSCILSAPPPLPLQKERESLFFQQQQQPFYGRKMMINAWPVRKEGKKERRLKESERGKESKTS